MNRQCQHRILVAPDSYKGSLDAPGLCRAIESGIRRACPDAQVMLLPLADGGEGTAEQLAQVTGGKMFAETVCDPLGRPVEASFGVLGDGATAVIELAQASGLTRLGDDERDPLSAGTYGTGQLILAALGRGYRTFVVGLGGSATNDGGTGMMRALGVRFLDADGHELPDGGAALARLAEIDASGLDPRARESEWLVASDVRSPLCGPRGASVVFGPQKGAGPREVAALDAALGQYAAVLERSLGVRVAELPGSGAAGGTGAALLAFLGAAFRPGIDYYLDAADFDVRLAEADLVITGEGRLDGQTLAGKAIAGICARAGRQGVPVVALCGGVEASSAQMEEIGLAACLSIVPGPCSLDQALASAERWTEERAEQLMRLLLIGSPK